MSDESLQDTAPKATKTLLGALAFILIMVGVEVIVDKDGPRYILGGSLILAGVILSYAAYAWTIVRKKLPNSITIEVNTIATSPRWWLAILLFFIATIILSPFIEQRRWPFFESNASQSPVVIHDPPSAEDIAKATAVISNQLNIVTQQRDSAVAKAATLSRQLEEARKEASTRPLSDDSIHNARISLDKLTTIMSRFQERRLLFVEGCDQYQKLLNALTYYMHPSNAFFAQKVENASKEIAEDYSNYYSKSADMPTQSDNFPQGVPLQDEEQKLSPQQQYQLRKWGYWCGRTISRIGGIDEEYRFDKSRLEQTILQK